MPESQMLINYVPGEECRVAIVEDGRLEELYVEKFANASRVGNIYVGNLRSALATDLYTTKGASEDAEVFVPMFTQVRETKPTRLTTFPTSYR